MVVLLTLWKTWQKVPAWTRGRNRKDWIFTSFLKLFLFGGVTGTSRASKYPALSNKPLNKDGKVCSWGSVVTFSATCQEGGRMGLRVEGLQMLTAYFNTHLQQSCGLIYHSSSAESHPFLLLFFIRAVSLYSSRSSRLLHALTPTSTHQRLHLPRI